MRHVPRATFAVMASMMFAVTAFLVTDIAPSFGPFHAGPGMAEANVTVVSLTHSPETVNTTTIITYKCIISGPAFVVRLVLRRPDQAQDLWFDMKKTDAVTYEYSDGPYNSPGHTVRYRVEVFDGNNITQYPSDGSFIIIPIPEPPEDDGNSGNTTNMNAIYLILGAIVLIMVLLAAVGALISAKSRQRDEKKYASMIQRDKDALLPPSANIIELPGSKRAQKKRDMMAGKKQKSDRPADRDLYAADGADALYEDEVDGYYDGYGEDGKGYGEGQGDGYGYGADGKGGGYGAGAAGGEGYYDDGYGDYPADDGYDYQEPSYAPEGGKGTSSKEYGEWYDERSYYQPQQQQQRAQPRSQAPQQQQQRRPAQPQPQQQQQRAQPRPQQAQQRPPQQPQKAQPKPQAPQQQKRPAQPQQPQRAQVKPQAQQKPSQPQQQQKRPAQQTQPVQPRKRPAQELNANKK